jgi:hypothetical protein
VAVLYKPCKSRGKIQAVPLSSQVGESKGLGKISLSECMLYWSSWQDGDKPPWLRTNPRVSVTILELVSACVLELLPKKRAQKVDFWQMQPGRRAKVRDCVRGYVYGPTWVTIAANAFQLGESQLERREETWHVRFSAIHRGQTCKPKYLLMLNNNLHFPPKTLVESGSGIVARSQAPCLWTD